jgi:hypothetical protein
LIKRLYFRDGSRTTLSLKTTISLLRQSQKHFAGCGVVVLGVALGVVVLGVVLGVIVLGVVLGVVRVIGVVRKVVAGVVFTSLGVVA